MKYGAKFGNKLYKGYDSGIEKKFHETEDGKSLTREKLDLPYVLSGKYQPDFHRVIEMKSMGHLLEKDEYEVFECKGMYIPADAKKMLLALTQATIIIRSFTLVLSRYNPKWIKWLELTQKKLPGIKFGVIYVR